MPGTSSRSGDVITSLSSGDLALAKIGEDGLLEEGRTWKAHDYEPWVAAWDCWSEGVAYSGNSLARYELCSVIDAFCPQAEMIACSRLGTSVGTASGPFGRTRRECSGSPFIRSLLTSLNFFFSRIRLWDAGVTCIQTSPHVPNIVAVGSCVAGPPAVLYSYA